MEDVTVVFGWVAEQSWWLQGIIWIYVVSWIWGFLFFGFLELAERIPRLRETRVYREIVADDPFYKPQWRTRNTGI